MEIGDVVKLQHSSRKMTVSCVYQGSGIVSAVWFDDDGHLQTAQLHPDSLVLVQETPERTPVTPEQ